MHPILVRTEWLTLPTYGVFYLAAYLAAIFMAAHLARREGVPFWRMVDITFQFSIAGEIGARLTFVIVEWDRFRAGTISAMEFLQAGRVVLGGLLVGAAVAVWLFRRHKLPVLGVLDAAVTGTVLGMGIGRLGCLMSGCCFGKPTDWWWGITFTDPLAEAISGTPLGVALHPTQILQSLDGFLLFAFLYWMFPRRKFAGQNVALFLLIQGTTRFVVEFLRGDPRGEGAGLATSQWIGLGMVATGIVLWRLARSRGAAAGKPHRSPTGAR